MACQKCQEMREKTKAQVVCCSDCAGELERELVALLMEMTRHALVMDDDDEVIH